MGNCLSSSGSSSGSKTNQVVPVDANGAALAPKAATAAKGNQVLPEPIKPGAAANQRQQQQQTSSFPALQQKWPELAQLAQLCTALALDAAPAKAQQLASLEQRAQAALQQLERAGAPKPTAGELRAATDACRACIDALLAPVAAAVDRMLGGAAPPPSSPSSSTPVEHVEALDETWDTVSAQALLQAMQRAAQQSGREAGDRTVRGGGSGHGSGSHGGGAVLRALGGALRPLAELLLWECRSLQAQLVGGSFHAASPPSAAAAAETTTSPRGSRLEHAAEGGAPAPLRQRELLPLLDLGSGGDAKAAAAAPDVAAAVPGVPAVDRLVGMLGVVLFRRTVLESQASLQERQRHVEALAGSLLGWPAPALAACCSAPQRALLLALHAPAALARGERRVKLTVRRRRAFWDAMEQVTSQHPDLLPWPISVEVEQEAQQPCKLFPSFVEEWAAGGGGVAAAATAPVEAGEGHGPRKEFFVLAGAGAAGRAAAAMEELGLGGGAGLAGQGGAGEGEEPALLVFNRTAGAYWFNTQLRKDDKLQRAYAFLGWLVGQAVLNRAPLGLPLPPLLLALLLAGGPGRFAPSPAHLASFDPAAAAAARRAAALPPGELRAVLDLEGLPAAWTGAQYLAHAARAALGLDNEDDGWQARAMAVGAARALGWRHCEQCCAGAAELAAFLSGGGGGDAGGPVDLRRVFRVVMDEELRPPEGAGAPVGELLWEVLGGWPRERQLAFVEFVTGTRRLPLPGTELLKVESPFVALGAARCGELLGTLPQAHTCDNLLELPNYWTALLTVRKQVGSAAKLPPDEVAALRRECRQLLEDRLTTAITGCMGYGLDERG